jgi:hypothetical protein
VGPVLPLQFSIRLPRKELPNGLAELDSRNAVATEAFRICIRQGDVSVAMNARALRWSLPPIIFLCSSSETLHRRPVDRVMRLRSAWAEQGSSTTGVPGPSLGHGRWNTIHIGVGFSLVVTTAAAHYPCPAGNMTFRPARRGVGVTPSFATWTYEGDAHALLTKTPDMSPSARSPPRRTAHSPPRVLGLLREDPAIIHLDRAALNLIEWRPRVRLQKQHARSLKLVDRSTSIRLAAVTTERTNPCQIQ